LQKVSIAILQKKMAQFLIRREKQKEMPSELKAVFGHSHIGGSGIEVHARDGSWGITHDKDIRRQGCILPNMINDLVRLMTLYP
jgi:hypothetical protein